MENNETIRAINNLDQRLRKIENIFKPSGGSKNLDVLGDAKIKRINSTVRIKDVKLVYLP